MQLKSTNPELNRLSPYEIGCLLRKKIKETGTTQNKLAAALGVPFGAVNKLVRLADSYPYLPQGWQRDLNRRPDDKSDPPPAIRFDHWIRVRPYIRKCRPSLNVIQLLVRTQGERWTASRLSRELALLSEGEASGSFQNSPAIAAERHEPHPLSGNVEPKTNTNPQSLAMSFPEMYGKIIDRINQAKQILEPVDRMMNMFMPYYFPAVTTIIAELETVKDILRRNFHLDRRVNQK